MFDIHAAGLRVKAASAALSSAGTATKNNAIAEIAGALESAAEEILRANAEDMAMAKENGVPDTMLDRLKLTRARIDSFVAAAREVMLLEDPVGEVVDGSVRPNGMAIRRVRVPLGAVGIICEARPNVTVDAAVLCLKSGNACLLRGGKEAIRSNTALVNIMRGAVGKAGLPADCICLVEDTSRESANAMMKLHGVLDVLIPRGGAGLIRTVVENSTVPVIETGAGVCHVYIDAGCDLDMAVKIAVNSKCDRPSVCNSAETFLVHRAVAERFLRAAKPELDRYKTEIRGCETTELVLGEAVRPATEEDYYTEYNDFIVNIKVVDSLEEAVAHIGKYGTHHSDCIVTERYAAAHKFQNEVDSVAVYHNVSTRFTDGGEFGLGAEIGISNQKLHVRGPMGVRSLTSTKYVISGSGQIR